MLAIPAIAVLVLALLSALEQLREFQHSVQTKQIISLVTKIDSVAHQLAKERGITQSAMSHEGKSTQQAILSARSETDIVVADLNQLIKTEGQVLLSSDDQERVAEIQYHLNRRHEIRNDIENRDNDHNSFFRYSEINAFLLDLEQRLAVTIDDIDMLKQTSAMAALLWMKERAGQERGLVAALLAGRSVSVENYSLIKGYIVEQETASNDFLRNASDSQRTRFLQVMGEVENLRFHKMRTFIEPRTLEWTTVIDPLVWFQTATDRIEGIRSVATDVGNDVRQQATDRYNQARAELIILLSLFCILLGGSLLISYLIGRKLALEITSSAEVIRDIERTGDLSLRLEIQNDDEVGKMSRAVNSLCDSLERAVSDVNRVVTALAKGDFSQKIEGDYKGEINRLKKGVNGAVDTVRRFHDFGNKK